MTSAGKRKPRYGSGVVLVPAYRPRLSGPRQPDNAVMPLDEALAFVAAEGFFWIHA